MSSKYWSKNGQSLIDAVRAAQIPGEKLQAVRACYAVNPVPQYGETKGDPDAWRAMLAHLKHQEGVPGYIME